MPDPCLSLVSLSFSFLSNLPLIKTVRSNTIQVLEDKYQNNIVFTENGRNTRPAIQAQDRVSSYLLFSENGEYFLFQIVHNSISIPIPINSISYSGFDPKQHSQAGVVLWWQCCKGQKTSRNKPYLDLQFCNLVSCALTLCEAINCNQEIKE